MTLHRRWRSPDLMLDVNYRDDWVEARYELGHTLWITVTESDGVTVKATAEVTSRYVDYWDDTGFTPSDEDWTPNRPDIQPGDWVFGEVDNGFTTGLQIFTINGAVDVDNDNVSGNLDATWYVGVVDRLDVECHPWGAWGEGWNDVQVKYSEASPDGSVPYLCEWNPGSEWDVDYGQEIAIWVRNPDGNQVINVFQGEAVELVVWKWHQGGHVRPDGVIVYGIYYQNNGSVVAENTQISDDLPLYTSYAGDTSGFPVTIGPGQTITWDMGSVQPGENGYIWVTLDVSASAPEGEGVIAPNCVNISSSTTPEMDPGNEDSCSDPVDVWDDDVELGIDKWSDPGDPTPGQEFIYKLRWCNGRGAAAGPVSLTDTLPAGVTLLEWREAEDWMHFWSEDSFDGTDLVLSAPGLPGNECREVELVMLLEPGVSIGTELVNTAVLDVADDVDLDNNYDEHILHAGPPRYDMAIDKQFHNGELYPGGSFNYFISYFNNGNTVSGVTITETVPVGLIYNGARWGGDQEGENEPLPDPVVDGDLLIWTLDPLSINDSRWFHVDFTIDPDTAPGTEFGNCVEITGDGLDDNPTDNFSCETVIVNPPGPNLGVFKEGRWQNDNQELFYHIEFQNTGSESFFDVPITDTLPLGTGMIDEPWNNFGSPVHNFDLGGNVWQFIVEALHPGDRGDIYFNVALDDASQRPVWYTNIVEIEIPPGDVDSSDNADEDVAFSGGELSRVEFWLNNNGSSNMWGEALPGSTITVTTAYNQYYAWADPDCGGCWNIDDTSPIEAGDVVEVIAGAGIIPVVVTIPDPLTAAVDSATDEVYGQIGGWSERLVEIHGSWDDGYREVISDPSGSYLTAYPDIPHGGSGYIRFTDEIDFATVIYHRPMRSLDLILDIDYGHDWVEARYELGHTMWITVTESDGVTVKATAEVTSQYVDPWHDTGFPSGAQIWTPAPPDLEPQDWVFALVDNGYSSTSQIGEISGELDTGADTVSGTVTAAWFGDPLAAKCEIWGNDGPSLDFMVDPDGGSYLCEFAPTGWNLEPGQDVAVSYDEPDGNRIINVFQESLIAQEIPLNAGWNMISSHVQPEDCDLDTMLAPIAGEMVLLKNGFGDVYWPDMGIDNIGCWNLEHGYQLYMNDAATLPIAGEPVNPQDWPIDLDSGWSLISYLRDGPLGVDQALITLGGELLLAKNGFGQVYWPAFGVNQIGTMAPGQGYQVYLFNPVTLTYPANNTPNQDWSSTSCSTGSWTWMTKQEKCSPRWPRPGRSPPDRTVYTFTLRSDALWSDGTPLTAHDARYGILRNIGPEINSELRWILFDINNAQAYNEGAIGDPDLVGITVLMIPISVSILTGHPLSFHQSCQFLWPGRCLNGLSTLIRMIGPNRKTLSPAAPTGWRSGPMAVQ